MTENNDDNVRLMNTVQKLQQELGNEREERKLLEIEMTDIKRSLERFQLISDFAHDWEMWYLPEGKIEYISPSFQTITGYAPPELLSSPGLIDSIIIDEDLSEYKRFIDDAINFVNIRKTLRFRILTRTKQVRWCEIKCKAVYNKRGKYLGQRASIGDITKLMQAMGQIKDLSEGKQVEARIKQKYLRDIENKDWELVSFIMAISQKNETIQYARRQITQLLKNCSQEQKEILGEIVGHLNNSLQSSETWDSFKLHFESINPGFFERLSAGYPQLTSRDLKICGYIRLGLSTKEIAVLQNITFQSAEISRVRLRKKLNLTRDINLADFLGSL